MHVRKFEGDTLDEVIGQVKRELGPDAIILKTKTNKGLSGAFKKSRVEITAAISERSYVSKAKVDRIIPDEMRESFYRNSAEDVNKTIKNYNASYSNLGLNKPVNSAKTQNEDQNSQRASGLDAFLSSQSQTQTQTSKASSNRVQLHEFISDIEPQDEYIQETEEKNFIQEQTRTSNVDYSNQLKLQEEKIRQLEQKLGSLIQNMTVQNGANKGPRGISELRTTLKTLDIGDRIVNKLLKKINSTVSYKDQEDSDVVFDVALSELSNLLTTSYANFSKVSDKSTITIFISEGAAGQSTCIRKLAALKPNAKILTLVTEKTGATRVDKLLNLDVEEVVGISEIVSYCRRNEDSENALFIDINPSNFKNESFKDLVENLKRVFSDVEVLLSISSIHSEIYNRKIVSKYSNFVDGIIINHIDKCLNYGALINIHEEYNKIPLVFYGTGRLIPEDIEAATSERLMASLFKL